MRPAHSYFVEIFKEHTGIPMLDGSPKSNVNYARLIETKIRHQLGKDLEMSPKDVPIARVVEGFETLLQQSDKDDWIRKNMTDLRLLHYKFLEILNK
ncbi:MAG: hypothetical protein QGH82_06880 [Candidatus Woesearchaeota archaeon]|jgi:uncharacterized protein YPO0396|nr:hypothetical protein [Candidatus Woesearchaeota archaeon]